MKNVHKTILSGIAIASLVAGWGIVYANVTNNGEQNTVRIEKIEVKNVEQDNKITDLEKVDVRREEQYDNILKAIEKLTETIEKLHE